LCVEDEMKVDWSAALVLEWAGRLAAGALVLLWGAFFVAHLFEWFLQGSGRFPPPHVWVAQALHLAMLLGLALIAVRPLAGSVATLIGTAAFFGWIGAFPTVAALNFIPPALVGLSALLKMGSASASGGA
jgi:hypothetical protein